MADANNRTYAIYGLASSEDGVIRYIGQTSRSLPLRLKEHVRKCVHEEGAKAKWIRSVLAAEHKIVIRPLMKTQQWHEAERRVIALYRKHGFSLMNSTSGGQGVPGLPVITRERIRDSLRGHVVSDEVRRHLSHINTARYSNPAERRRTSSSTKRAMARETVRANTSAAAKTRWADAENRARQSDRVRNWCKDPNVITTMAHAKAKVSDADVLLARRMRGAGSPLSELCARFGIAKGPMSMLCRGLTHKHVPMPLAQLAARTP